MAKLFNFESPVMQKLNKIVDLMILNVMMLVGCIPVFTIGAAITALYATVGRLDRDECCGVIRSFFEAFRSNFKQATIIELILTPVGIFVFLVLMLMQLGDVVIPVVLQILAFTLGIIFFLIAAWVFPLQSRFDNPVKTTLKNALICSVLYLPKSLVMVVLNLIPWGMLFSRTIAFIEIFPLWLFVWFSLSAYLNYRMNRHFFMGSSIQPDEVDQL